MKYPRFSYLFSLLSIIYSPLYSSDNQENQETSSRFITTLQLMKPSNKDPLEKSLQLIHTDLTKTLSTPLRNIQEMDGIPRATNEAKQNVNITQSLLRDITRELETPLPQYNKNTVSGLLRTPQEFLSFLNGMQLPIHDGINLEALKNLIHTRSCVNSQPFCDVSGDSLNISILGNCTIGSSPSGAYRISPTPNVCICDKWARVVLSCNEGLKEKAHLEKTCDQQKSILQNVNTKSRDMSNTLNNMDNPLNIIGQQGSLALTTLQDDREVLFSHMKNQKEQLAFVLTLTTQLNEDEKAFQAQLLKMAQENEEEQKEEKLRLQKEIEEKEEQKKREIENIMQHQQVLTQRIQEERDTQKELLSEKDAKILDLITEKHKNELAYLQEKIESNNKLQETTFNQKMAQQKAQREQETFSLNTRSFLANLITKLPSSNAQARDKNLGLIANEEISLADLIKKLNLAAMKNEI